MISPTQLLLVRFELLKKRRGLHPQQSQEPHPIELLRAISLCKLRRAGVGFGLVPFAQSVGVYFLAGRAGEPSAAAVAAKVAPVLCLLLFVLAHHGAAMHPKGWYARRIALGLALSALGDALLVWPARLAGGMGAFAAAHVAYISAFRFEPRAPRLALLLLAATVAFLLQLRPPAELRLAVPLYALALAGAAWRGAARGGAAAGGALLFLLSDAILAYGLFVGPLPYYQVLVMSTYYLGQLGIALSVLEQ